MKLSPIGKKTSWYALLLSLFLSYGAKAQDRPNIVIILADDLGYGDVGFNGCPDIPTPNIDALAAGGVQCSNAYVTEPFCSPSRAALMTGRYQQRFGYDSGPEDDNDNPLLGLPLTEMTMAEMLKPAGYVSGAFGKWHLGTAAAMFPLARGFDEFVGFLDAQAIYYHTLLYNGYTLYREQSYLTDAFTREAVSFINNHATQPFLLYLAYNAVHAPYDQAPDVYQQIVSGIPDPDRRNYAAMTVALDTGIGEVVAALQANNIYGNTLIFFLSDNGAPNMAWTVQSNAPLRGYKTDVLEGGIRVPFAVQWPDRLTQPAIYSGMVSSMDIFATVANVAGVTLPLDRVYDGQNIIPFLASEKVSPIRTLFWRWLGLGPNGPKGSLNTIWAVRSGSSKLVVERHLDNKPPALYNLTKDIGETTNQAARYPTQVATLQSAYNQWQLDTLPARWQKDSDDNILPVVLAGDWNGFNKDDLNPPWNLLRTTAPDPVGTPDAYNWLTDTIHVSSTAGDTTPGDHTFTIVGAGSYKTQWAGTPIQIDAVTDLPHYSGSALGPPNTITFEDESYYSFRIIDISNQSITDMHLAVFKTSAPPVTVTRTSQTPEYPGPTDPIVVTIAPSQPLSPEERIYIRWSNDFFITSQIVEATGADTSYTATIPAQPDGVSALYTVLTSTADLTGLSGSAAIDELTLATTGVFNAVPPIPVTITQQPQSVSVKTGKKAKFTVIAAGSGPLKYQWKKNGIDISGATKSIYQTPSTTSDDNGAVFSVVVTGRAGGVLSDGAILTLL